MPVIIASVTDLRQSLARTVGKQAEARTPCALYLQARFLATSFYVFLEAC